MDSTWTLHTVDRDATLMVMGDYTRRAAARKLGVDEKTLDKWAKRLGIEPAHDQFDTHICIYTDGQLLTIAQARENYWALRQDALPEPLPQKVIEAPVSPSTSSDLPYSAPERHSERSRPSRRYSNKPPLPEGWISFEEAWAMTGIAGNWEKSQVDKAHWATPGPFLRDRSTIMWAFSPEQQKAFFAHYGRG